MFFKELGDLIRTSREAKGLSQETFALRIGKNQSDISKWETGVAECPKEIFYLIADELGILEYQLWNALKDDVTGAYQFDNEVDFNIFDDKVEKIIEAHQNLYRRTWEHEKENLNKYFAPIFRYGELCEEFHIGNKNEIVKDFINGLTEEYQKNKKLPTNLHENFSFRYFHSLYVYTLISMLQNLNREEDLLSIVTLVEYWMSGMNLNNLNNKEMLLLKIGYHPSLACGKVLEDYLTCLNQYMHDFTINDFSIVPETNLFETYSPIRKSNKNIICLTMYLHIERRKLMDTWEQALDKYLETLNKTSCLPCIGILVSSHGDLNRNLFSTRLARRCGFTYEEDHIKCRDRVREVLPWVK